MRIRITYSRFVRPKVAGGWWGAAVAVAAAIGCSMASGPVAARDDVDSELASVAELLELTIQVDPAAAIVSMQRVRERLLNRPNELERFEPLRRKLEPLLRRIMAEDRSELRRGALLLLAAWQDPAAIEELRSGLFDASLSDQQRGETLRVLLRAAQPPPVDAAVRLVCDRSTSKDLSGRILQELAVLSDPNLVQSLLPLYDQMDGTVRPQLIELLTQRPAWATRLLQAIQQGRLPKEVLHAQQLLRLESAGDPNLSRLVRQVYGRVRMERNPEREKVINDVRQLLAQNPGNAYRGQEVFRRLCAQCHRIYGQGHDVGPDLTRNGRGSFDQLLSNVLDPNLVVGEAYQSHIVVTTDGRILTGLLVEQSPKHVALKLQGGKLETVPRSEIEQYQVSPLSLMPEGIEKQLSPEELADLFAFLRLDQPPSDPGASALPEK